MHLLCHIFLHILNLYRSSCHVDYFSLTEKLITLKAKCIYGCYFVPRINYLSFRNPFCLPILMEIQLSFWRSEQAFKILINWSSSSQTKMLSFTHFTFVTTLIYSKTTQSMKYSLYILQYLEEDTHWILLQCLYPKRLDHRPFKWLKLSEIYLVTVSLSGHHTYQGNSDHRRVTYKFKNIFPICYIATSQSFCDSVISAVQNTLQYSCLLLSYEHSYCCHIITCPSLSSPSLRLLHSTHNWSHGPRNQVPEYLKMKCDKVHQVWKVCIFMYHDYCL
jgi:hypothetical protein